MQNNFEEIAHNYQKIHKKSLLGLSDYDLDYFLKYKIDILKEESDKSPENILDFGCGIGKSCGYLSVIFPEAKITGIDSSENSVKIAEENNKNNEKCSFFTGNINEIKELQKKKYDLIFVSCVMHHIELSEQKAIFNILLSKLTDNGKMYIFEHNPYNPLTALVFKTSEIDRGLKMVSPYEMQKFREDNETNRNVVINPPVFTLFVPRFRFLEKWFFIDKYFKKLPIGAQYYIKIEKETQKK